MVSEVNNSPSTLVQTVDNRATRIEKPVTAPSPAAGPNPEVVTLTDLGSRLQTLTQAVADVPAVDSQRVEFFRQAIADGSYQVDADAVAEKLTNFEAMLANLPQGK